MNKREYLAQLERELKRNHVPDAGEILNEYAQHFAFKLADGYSEEEISARLGEPAALAAQFDGPSAPPKAGNKPLAAFGLCFVDLLAVCLFLTLLAWSLAMGAAALSSIEVLPTGKFHVDLKGLNAKRLESAGLDPEHIAVSADCTCCLPEKYWSHRVTHGERGSQAAMIELL